MKNSNSIYAFLLVALSMGQLSTGYALPGGENEGVPCEGRPVTPPPPLSLSSLSLSPSSGSVGVMMAAASAGSSERDIEDRQRAPYLQQDGRMVYDEYEDLLRFDGEARKDAGYEDNKKRLQRDGQKAFRVIAGLGNEKTQEEEFDRMLNERHECDIYEMNTLVAILRLAEEYGENNNRSVHNKKSPLYKGFQKVKKIFQKSVDRNNKWRTEDPFIPMEGEPFWKQLHRFCYYCNPEYTSAPCYKGIQLFDLRRIERRDR